MLDTLTCPSPNVFRSDKGRFSDADSVYPPRNDLFEFDSQYDHPDTKEYEALNDLDAVVGATPSAGATNLSLPLTPALAGPLVAFIEVSLEHDENADWDFDRELDHAVDAKLPDYGIEWLGQPSVVYRVALDPTVPGFTGTLDFAGYGDWDGASGTLHAPDDTISTDQGSGADRLRPMQDFGQTFRFGVSAQ